MTATIPRAPHERAAFGTLCAGFAATAAAEPERVALRTPGDGVRLTWRDYDARVRDAAARLAALGVRRGDAVVLLLTARPEAAWADVAALQLGAAGISLYLAGTPETMAYVVADSGARVLVCERALAARAAALRRACPALEHVVSVDGAADGVPALDEVPPARLDVDASAAAVVGEDRATLMYTSGTMGTPKGTAYSHAAITRAFACLDAALPALDDLHAVAFIPFAHAGQRAMGHFRSLLRPSTTTFCADPATLPAALRDARPTSLFAPPAVWQSLAAGARRLIAAEPDTAARQATEAALGRALEAVRLRRAPQDDAHLAAVRARLGLDRVVHPMVSGAPAPDELLELLHALGLPVMNLYALTELPPITVARPHPADIGTAGRALPGVRVRIGEDGEVLVRHPAASSGYHARPDATAALFAPDGWARTGDLGQLDDQGRLRLRGRRDERIVTSFGTNVDPEGIELLLCAPPILHACVVGDGRPYLTAVLCVAPGTPADAVAEAVAAANAQLPEVARIRHHVVVEDRWRPGGDEVTPTMKLRRRTVRARYAAEIEALYAAGAGR